MALMIKETEELHGSGEYMAVQNNYNYRNDMNNNSDTMHIHVDNDDNKTSKNNMPMQPIWSDYSNKDDI